MRSFADFSHNDFIQDLLTQFWYRSKFSSKGCSDYRVRWQIAQGTFASLILDRIGSCNASKICLLAQWNIQLPGVGSLLQRIPDWVTGGLFWRIVWLLPVVVSAGRVSSGTRIVDQRERWLCIDRMKRVARIGCPSWTKCRNDSTSLLLWLPPMLCPSLASLELPTYCIWMLEPRRGRQQQLLRSKRS